MRRGDEPGRKPTKAERREQARLERERIQKQMAARGRNRKIGLGLAAAAIAGAIVAAIVAGTGSDTNLPSPQQLLSRADDARRAAGCEDVQTIGAYRGVADPADPAYQDTTHIDPGGSMPPLATYPSFPPTSGPHNPVPLPAGVYDDPPPVDQVLHSLEHGAAVVWFDPDAPAGVIDRITAFYGQGDQVGQDRVIVAPYDYPDQGEAGSLPIGKRLALVAWHRLEACTDPDLAVAFDFTSQYSFPTYDDRAYQGEAPEPGKAF